MMKAKVWIAAALALTAVCGMASVARAGSGRATGPTKASPAPPPPPQEQKPPEPPKSQRPTEGGANSNEQRKRPDDSQERVRLFEKYRKHRG